MGKGRGCCTESNGTLLSTGNANTKDSSMVCKNITAFLLEQNRQFEEGVGRIDYAKDILAPAKLVDKLWSRDLSDDLQTSQSRFIDRVGCTHYWDVHAITFNREGGCCLYSSLTSV